MKCEKAQDCMADMLAAGETPPLEPGETEVATVDVPMGPSPAPAASFLQGSAAAHQATKLLVNYTSMGFDHTVQKGQIELALTQIDAAALAGTSWVKELHEESGEESEASCKNGLFQCRGDVAWCAEQERLICSGGPPTSLRQKLHTQSHLQA
jgi:hypothetical protein